MKHVNAFGYTILCNLTTFVEKNRCLVLITEKCFISCQQLVFNYGVLSNDRLHLCQAGMVFLGISSHYLVRVYIRFPVGMHNNKFSKIFEQMQVDFCNSSFYVPREHLVKQNSLPTFLLQLIGCNYIQLQGICFAEV